MSIGRDSEIRLVVDVESGIAAFDRLGTEALHRRGERGQVAPGCGAQAADDTLPDRFTQEPSPSAGSKGHVCELDLMLEEYYAARGWEDGVVPESKLEELDVP